MKARRKFCVTALAAITTATALVVPSAALAEGPPAVDSMEMVNAVQNVEPGVALAESSDGFTASTAGTEVTIPSDANGGLVLTPTEGVSLSVGLPGSSDGEAVDDGVVFDDAAVDTSIVAKATEDGGAQILVVLESAEAPEAVPFPISAPEGSSLQQNDDGTVSVLLNEVLGDGESILTAEIGTIAAPWAFDANGEAVPTSYSIDGMTLIQHIDTNETVAFPVTADPTVSTGWGGLYIRWTRSDALRLNGVTMTAVGAGVATLCSGITLLIGTAACVAATAGIFYLLKDLGDYAVNRQYDRGCRMETQVVLVRTYWKC